MKIIAHRGASGYAPENTLASFNKAISMNVKAIEFDVQMTKDGQVVVIHDYYVNRTSNGEGLVMNLDYTEMMKLDAGSWFDKKFSNERIPLLSEVLDIMPSYMEIHIELKKIMIDTRDLGKAVYDIVVEKGMLGQVIFSSFDHNLLKQLQGYNNVEFGPLFNTNIINPIKYIIDNGLNNVSVNPSIVFVTKEIVEEAHKHNLKVYSFTVNDKLAVGYCDSIGVDGIFTNFPDILGDLN